MPLILYIETATQVCSVALSNGLEILSLAETHLANSHSSLIAPYIEKVCKDVSVDYKSLDAVCVSKGPGSYTGLRIGVSAAKGLCYALQKPLLSVSTLESMAQSFLQSNHYLPWGSESNVLLCPMIDARRMEVYSALYDASLNERCAVDAVIINTDSFAEYLSNHKILFFGDGASKCKEYIQHTNAFFFDDFRPSATGMVSIAVDKFENKKFEDLAYFEPFYLKEFIAGKPKVKGLN